MDPLQDDPEYASSPRSASSEGQPPPLPPRPETINLLNKERNTHTKVSRNVRQSTNQNLLSKATTALSLTDISPRNNQDSSQDPPTVGFGHSILGRNLKAKASLSQLASSRGSEIGDSAGIRSYFPNSEPGDEDGLFEDFIHTDPSGTIGLSGREGFLIDDIEDDFMSEFQPVGELEVDCKNEELLLERWKGKRKHYIILSAAGKPIYTRHGDGGLVSSYVGIIQTIISFYHHSDDALRSFSAGDTKFVILIQGPLYLVAISRILESDTQLRLQLEALYMQILSTLTLPALTHLFSIRPSTDLKRPLQGTESLLSSLADTFTKGSPTTLLSALECLKIREVHRQSINNALLKSKVESLLYGLVVAGGRLVSVVRPKKHSLHPGDLQLLFNMIFEADGVKAGGGESWIPVCLPGFNNSGYLYMYVSFLDLRGEVSTPNETTTKDKSVAIVLISPNKGSFFELQAMKDAFVEKMENNGSIKIIKEAIDNGRPLPAHIVPNTPLRHFIFKSKVHVQFVMSSYEPDFQSMPRRRRLFSVYNLLHASVHSRHTHVKAHHSVSKSASSLALVTPTFELYCVASPTTHHASLSQSASKVIQWIQQEEERLFIIGGAVF